MDESEDRQYPRQPTKLRVEVRSELEAEIHGTARDIAMAGLFVVSAERLPVGTLCEVSIECPDPDGPDLIHASGRVTHVQLDGMGLQITEIDLEDRDELRRLVDSQRA